MKPEDGVKRRNLDNTHMTQSEDVVQTIVKCLEIPNLAAIRLVTYLTERLVGRQQLVKHVAEVRLLFADSRVDIAVTASSIGSMRIKWVPNSVVPVLELEFAQSSKVIVLQRMEIVSI